MGQVTLDIIKLAEDKFSIGKRYRPLSRAGEQLEYIQVVSSEPFRNLGTGTDIVIDKPGLSGYFYINGIWAKTENEDKLKEARSILYGED